MGQGRTSRALAIVHIAMFDAVNAIVGGYDSYTDLPRVHPVTSIRAAIAQAAHDTLAVLYPSQKGIFAEALTDDLNDIPEGRAKGDGVALGQKAAAAILALRTGGGSEKTEPRVDIDYIPKSEPGKWRQDPIGQIPIALGAYWGKVVPFVMESADQFRPPPAPCSGQSRICSRLQRGEVVGRRWCDHANSAHSEGNGDWHFLGL